MLGAVLFLSLLLAVPGQAAAIRFEAVPARINVGERATLHIQYDDPRNGVLVQILPSGARVTLASFTGPQSVGVRIPVMPPRTMRYQLVLTHPIPQQWEFLDVTLKVLRPHDPYHGLLPVIDSFTCEAEKRDGFNGVLRDEDGWFNVICSYTVRNAQTVKISEQPSGTSMWPGPNRAVSFPPPGPGELGTPRSDSVTVRAPPYSLYYVLRVANPNGCSETRIPPPYGSGPGAGGGFPPVGLTPPSRKFPVAIRRFTVQPGGGALTPLSPRRPGQPAELVDPPVLIGGEPPTLTVPVQVSMEIANPVLLRLHSGAGLVWESDELDEMRVTRDIRVQVPRGQTLRLRAYGADGSTAEAQARP